MTHQLRAISERTDTIVVLECEGIRERKAGESMHYRLEHDEPCYLCGAMNMAPNVPIIWIDNLDKWKLHPQRCLVK